MNNKTLSYYNSNAKQFNLDTRDVEFSTIQQEFLQYITPGALILDLGCGSGRDSKAFKKAGYQVEAMDGSVEMCRLASQLLGQEVKCQTFDKLEEQEKYDGIWACASILHLDKASLRQVLHNIAMALKEKGYFYASFKYGEFEGERNGRYFIDMTEERMEELLDMDKEFIVVNTRITGDVRPGRDGEKWLNLIMQKR